jgi:hypothetical protein
MAWHLICWRKSELRTAHYARSRAPLHAGGRSSPTHEGTVKDANDPGSSAVGDGVLKLNCAGTPAWLGTSKQRLLFMTNYNVSDISDRPEILDLLTRYSVAIDTKDDHPLFLQFFQSSRSFFRPMTHTRTSHADDPSTPTNDAVEPTIRHLPQLTWGVCG